MNVLMVWFCPIYNISDQERFQVFPFTSSTTDLSNFLHELRATGGGDEAEDVVGGLEEVLKLDWDGVDIKVLFHCADAPGHGAELHDGASDRFPDGVPGQRAWQEVINEFAERHIDIYFAQVPDPRSRISTRKMADQFGGVYDTATGYQRQNFTVLSNIGRYEPAELFTHVMASLSTSIYNILNSSISVSRRRPERRG